MCGFGGSVYQGTKQNQGFSVVVCIGGEEINVDC